MRRRLAGALAATLVLLAPTAAQGGADTAGTAPTRTKTFAVSTRRDMRVLPGRGRNVLIEYLRVDGKRMEFASNARGRTVTVYGYGIVLRFTQDGRTHRVAGVAVWGTHRVVLRYSIGGP